MSFMESYIDSRYQCTKINGCTLSYLKLSYGAAQGSILGPLIFILYVMTCTMRLTTNVTHHQMRRKLHKVNGKMRKNN